MGGPVGSITVRDVRFGADIRAGGTFDTRTSLTARILTNGTDVAADGQLKLTARRMDDGTVRAARLTQPLVAGDGEAGIAADFGSDVTIDPGRPLTAMEAGPPPLGGWPSRGGQPGPRS